MYFRVIVVFLVEAGGERSFVVMSSEPEQPEL